MEGKQDIRGCLAKSLADDFPPQVLTPLCLVRRISAGQATALDTKEHMESCIHEVGMN